MAPGVFRITIKDPATDEEYEIQPKSWEIKTELNKESTASFTVGYEDTQKSADAYNTTVLAIMTAKWREIFIERKNSSGVYTKIFWGAVTDFSLDPKGQGDQDFKFSAVSWFGLLTKRRAGIPSRIFTGVDAGEIAWTLIDESQLSDAPYSDLGITEGTITASVNRDRTYKFDNIRDSIYNLSASNLASGFDFEIDNTKAFNVYYPNKGVNKFNIVFEQRNLANWSFKKNLLLSMTNKVYVVGQATNEDVLYVTRNADNSYKTDWTLLEDKLNESDIITTGTLNDKGDRELAAKKVPGVEMTIEHFDDEIGWFDYDLGDNVKVNFPHLQLSGITKRIIRKTMTMDQDKSIGYIKTILDLVQ